MANPTKKQNYVAVNKNVVPTQTIGGVGQVGANGQVVVLVPNSAINPPKPKAQPKAQPKAKATPPLPGGTFVNDAYNMTYGAEAPDFSSQAKIQKKEFDAQQNLQAKAILDAQKLSDQQYAQMNEQGRQAIEQNQFQKYLQARQSMANRGLAGSGIAEDANARISMAGNADLSDMLSKNNIEQAKANQAYQAEVAAIYQKRDQMTEDDFKTEMRDAWERRQQATFDNLMKVVPYNQMTANEKATYATGMTGQLGYYIDPVTNKPVYSNGQLIGTLGRDKLNATVANNRASLDAKYANIDKDIAVASAKIKNTASSNAVKQKISVYKAQLQSLTTQMNSYTSKGLKVPGPLVTQYETANTNLYNILDSL